MEAVRPQTHPFADIFHFLRLWFKHPRSMGAVAPSSERLAAAIAREVDFDAPGVVVELGGGTGSITRALVARANDPRDIVVIEREASLCALLSARFPGVRVIQGDAQDLRRLLERGEIGSVKAVVSGLPLISIPGRPGARILLQAFAAMGPDGVFVQFTYGLASPVRRAITRKTGIVGRRSGWILRNLPPAMLWSYRHPGVMADAPA